MKIRIDVHRWDEQPNYCLRLEVSGPAALRDLQDIVNAVFKKEIDRADLRASRARQTGQAGATFDAVPPPSSADGGEM